jgi:hypothetical protein
MAYGTFSEQALSARVRCNDVRPSLDSAGVPSAVFEEIKVAYDSALTNPSSFISFRTIFGIGQGAPSSISLATYNALSEANQLNVVRLDDTDAPIGSEWTQLTVSGGAVTAAKKFLKTAANTWTAMGSVT